MIRPTPRFLLDLVLTFVFLGLIQISLLLHFVFPRPSRSRGWVLWSLDYDQWAFLQFSFLIGFCLLILLHLIVQWNWICGYVATRISKRLGRRVQIDESGKTIYGVGLLVVVLSALGFVLALGRFAIEKD